MNQEFLPDTYQYEGEKFNTTNHFLAITPFPWIEIAYVCTILKGIDKMCIRDRLNNGFELKVVEEAEPPKEMMDIPGMEDELRRR